VGLSGGTYYVAVISEGANPHFPYLGSNTVSYTLANLGPVGVANLGTLGSVDLTFTTNNQPSQTAAFYQFEVPSNVLSMEFRLEGVAGNPLYTLRRTSGLISLYEGYSAEGGWPATWSGSGVLTVPNPQPGTYSLTVDAARY